MTDRCRFAITLFPDVAAATLTTRKVDLSELRKLALDANADKKGDLPLVKLAVFGDKRTEKNSLRHNANVTSITGVEGDYDGEIVPFAEAVAAVKQSGLKALMYTSPSNTEDKPRWRILCPSSQALPPEEHGKLVARVNGVLGGILGPESFTLSQSYYIGHLNGAAFGTEVIPGDFVDARVDLDAGAVGKPQASTDNAAQEPRDNVRSDKQADPDLIFAAMAVVPNDAVNWNEWNSLGMACYLSTSGAQRGFEAFDLWSRKSPEHNKKDTTQERWQHYRTSPPISIGAGTIFQKADQAQPGWRSLKGLPVEKITEVLRLSRLAFAQYDTERKESAKQLGLRVSTLDDITGRLRSPDVPDADNLQGGRIEFVSLAPWGEPVDGETLIADTMKAVRDYVILSEHQALAVSLWVAHTHAFEVAEHAPRLQIRSPAMRSGKSTLLRTVAQLVAKPLKTENISTAALFRIIEKYQPTLLIDEADNFFKNAEGKDNSDLNGILNAGHEPTGTWTRTVGEDFEPRTFKVFSPLCFAWLVRRGVNVREQLEDRCITIELRRRLPDESISRFRQSRTGHLRELARRSARWVADHKAALADADPDMPEQLNDRAQDNWRPLIAVADAMSAALGQKAREAAVKIAAENIGGEEDVSLLLLADVAAIFKKKISLASAESVPSVGSLEIVHDLTAMDDRPWNEWRRGTPITGHTLARLLKAYGVIPRKIRPQATPADPRPKPFRAYFTNQVLEAAGRYVTEESEEDAS
jgi:putative DNA primase/helicase